MAVEVRLISGGTVSQRQFEIPVVRIQTSKGGHGIEPTRSSLGLFIAVRLYPRLGTTICQSLGGEINRASHSGIMVVSTDLRRYCKPFKWWGQVRVSIDIIEVATDPNTYIMEADR